MFGLTTANMTTFTVLRHPVTILVTVLTNLNNLTNDLKCDNKIKQAYFIINLKGPSVNRKDLRALTLVGPTRNNQVLEPLAVLHLDNQLYIWWFLWVTPFV